MGRAGRARAARPVRLARRITDWRREEHPEHYSNYSIRSSQLRISSGSQERDREDPWPEARIMGVVEVPVTVSDE